MARPKKKEYEKSENSCVFYVAVEHNGKRASREFEVTGLLGKLIPRDRNVDAMLEKAAKSISLD